MTFCIQMEIIRYETAGECLYYRVSSLTDVNLAGVSHHRLGPAFFGSDFSKRTQHIKCPKDRRCLSQTMCLRRHLLSKICENIICKLLAAISSREDVLFKVSEIFGDKAFSMH